MFDFLIKNHIFQIFRQNHLLSFFLISSYNISDPGIRYISTKFDKDVIFFSSWKFSIFSCFLVLRRVKY